MGHSFSYKNKTRLYRFKALFIGFNLILYLNHFAVIAQTCPPNIDFESATFDNWKCYTGYVDAAGGRNSISLFPSGGPAFNYHTMYAATAVAETDPYGGFPVNCPNGSGHSIKLGNNRGGGEAEGIAYEFTIPANQNAYTLIYNYAVVFQDPHHQEYEQPRMEIEVTNVTDNKNISCASFAFRPYGTALPGFKLSPNPGTNTPVWYKEWTAVSVNLDSNAGKTIRLLFKTADCTFRRHFGYAYIDVNSECSGTFTGATYCPDDTAVNVIAPYGYQSYTWYDNSLTRELGNDQVLTLSPLPDPGSILAVKLVPYHGYGCPQTLFTRLMDNLTVTSNAGPDTVSCNHSSVQIGAPPKPGLVYKWQPSTGLSNPHIANPFASPDTTTAYILTTNNSGGGCADTDTVVVHAYLIDSSLQLIGKPNYCLDSGDSSVLRVQPADSIQWFKDDTPVSRANQTEYRVTESGSYHAMLFNKHGCSMSTRRQPINISSKPVAAFAADSANQCLTGNRFVFTNSSANEDTMFYRWILGDGTEATTRDITHSYDSSGSYSVKMIVSSNPGCADSSVLPVAVYQNAIAAFSVKPVCISMPVPIVNNTIDTGSSPVNYTWYYDGQQVSKLRNPPLLTYSIPGTHTISLSVNTAQCPSPASTVTQTVKIDKPEPGVNYPVQYALVDLPLPLAARNLGDEVLWSPDTGLDDRTSYTPVFKGASEQLYTIVIETNSGCVTVDTQLVKTVKNVEVYVPTAFTPDNDGKNDYLRPLLQGVKEVRFFRVFNRWGQLLFETRTDKPGWDGTFKGAAQQTQTVVWMLEVTGIDGKTYVRKGTTVLLRK